MKDYERKIEIMDYVNVLWKRKLLIVLITLAFLSLSAFISLTSPVIWEVDAVILPPEITIKTENGIDESFFFVGPGKIIGRINQARYNEIIAAELNLDIQDLAGLKAENIRGTNFVRIHMRSEDTEKAKLILRSLKDYLIESLNKLPKRERIEINQRIERKKKEKSILEEKTKVLNDNLNSIRQRSNEIERDKSEIKKIMGELERERRSYLKKKNRSESETTNLLLLSNEIQNNQITYNILNESLRSYQTEEKIMNLETADTERRIDEIELEILDLDNMKYRITDTELVREPTSSTSPVTPQKYVPISIGALLGLAISIFLAFMIEHFRKT